VERSPTHAACTDRVNCTHVREQHTQAHTQARTQAQACTHTSTGMCTRVNHACAHMYARRLAQTRPPPTDLAHVQLVDGCILLDGQVLCWWHLPACPCAPSSLAPTTVACLTPPFRPRPAALVSCRAPGSYLIVSLGQQTPWFWGECHFFNYTEV